MLVLVTRDVRAYQDTNLQTVSEAYRGQTGEVSRKDFARRVSHGRSRGRCAARDHDSDVLPLP